MVFSKNAVGVVHKLRWQVVFRLFLTTYLRTYVDIFYLINLDKKSTFLDYIPLSSCKRSLWTTHYNTFLSNLSGNQTDWKQKQWDCLKMRIFQNPFCQLFFRWVLTLLSDSYNKFLSLIKNCVRQEKILKWEISSLVWFIMLIKFKSIACFF